MGSQGGIAFDYTMADDVKPHESNVDHHDIADLAHQ